MSCPFCNLDFNILSNTLIDKTDNFYVLPSRGALVRGYILIICKQHIGNMLDLNNAQKKELLFIIEKYRTKFYNIYGKYPIVFEHGDKLDNESASSISHAHIHMVNFNFKTEAKILKQLNFESFCNSPANSSYISYISPNGNKYITFNFKAQSQLFRKFIGEELGLKYKYNWKKYNFYKNILDTINDLKEN